MSYMFTQRSWCTRILIICQVQQIFRIIAVFIWLLLQPKTWLMMRSMHGAKVPASKRSAQSRLPSDSCQAALSAEQLLEVSYAEYALAFDIMLTSLVKFATWEHALSLRVGACSKEYNDYVDLFLSKTESIMVLDILIGHIKQNWVEPLPLHSLILWSHSVCCKLIGCCTGDLVAKVPAWNQQEFPNLRTRVS